VLTEAQIEDMIARKAQEISDKRVGGLQAMYDRKLKEIADENKRISRALAGTEDDPRSSDLEAEVRRLERQNRLLVAAQANPEIAPYIDRFGPDATPEDIATALVEIRESFAPKPPQQTPEPAPAVPDVEPNNPPRDRQGLELGANITERQADEYFAGLQAWPR